MDDQELTILRARLKACEALVEMQSIVIRQTRNVLKAIDPEWEDEDLPCLHFIDIVNNLRKNKT